LPLFHTVTMPLKSKKEEFKSDFFMEIEDGAATHNRYIIINKEAFNLASDPRIIQNLRLGNIRDEFESWPSHGTRIANISFPENMKWIKPELYFFTETLLFRETGNVLEEHNYNAAERFILPLKQEFFECFTGNESILELGPQFKEIGNDFEFSINIPVLFSGSKTYVRIRKIYKDNPTDISEGRIQEITIPPLLELWPDFYDPRWKRYFIYNNDSDVFRFKPLSKNISSELTIAGENVIDDGHHIMEIDTFPDALVCAYKGVDAGLILIKRSKPKSGIHWIVGIDFGTSNSNIWVKRGDASPEQLKFSIKSRKITNSPDDSRILLYKYFMPPRAPKVPFITILRVFEGDENLNHVLRDFAIQFIETTPQPDRRLKTNIKWSGSEALMKGFFEHLSLLITAEAMKDGVGENELSINVSYPLAFSAMQQTQFLAQWRNVLQKIKAYPGININMHGGPKDYTESACTGKYFEQRLNAKTTRPGAICIDVGGGTSDICVWSDGHIKFQTSIILAGNNISDAFRKSEGLCRTIFRDIEANPEDNSDDKKLRYVQELRNNIKNFDLTESDTHFSSVLNYYLKKYNERILQRLPNLVTDNFFNSLHDVLMVEFAAIVYYCGMVISKMRQDGSLAATANALNLYWGGGASAFIKWLDFGNPESGIIASTIFNEMISSFEIKSDRPKLTKNPKSETAFGLVAPREKNVEVANGLILGGDVFKTTSGILVDYLSEVEPEKLADFQSFDSGNGLGERFQNFIELLNKIRRSLGVKPVDLTIYSELSASIENTIGELADRIKRLSEDDMNTHIEPIFIIQVKELLREMIESME
jgi:hypothetical protein